MTLTLLGALIGISCVVALVVTAFADERLEAMALALTIGLAWLVYEGAWEGQGPAYWWADLLKWRGWSDDLKIYTATETALRELMTMALIVWFLWTNPARLWLWMMFGLCFAGVMLAGIDWLFIDAGLEAKIWRSIWTVFNAIMVAKLAIVLTLGGKGFGDAVNCWLRDLRGHLHPRLAASYQAAIARVRRG